MTIQNTTNMIRYIDMIPGKMYQEEDIVILFLKFDKSYDENKYWKAYYLGPYGLNWFLADIRGSVRIEEL